MTELALLFDNLFYPINTKHHGKWNPPLSDAKELVKYATNHSKNPNENKNWIEKYTSVNDKESGTLRTLFLDFDLTTTAYLKEILTEDMLNNFNLSTIIETPINFNGDEIEFLLNTLDKEDLEKLKKHAKKVEEDKLSKMSDVKKQEYFYNKIKEGYLKEPFNEAIKVAQYFEKYGVKTILNWSGSKGVHLRIPLNKLDFKRDTINKDPKLFIISLAKSIETIILDKPIHCSTLDYNVLNKNRGMERLPCSKHEVSHLYSNFFDPTLQYNEAIQQLTLKKPEYIPQIVNKGKNTETFLSLPLVKEAIETATTYTDIYPEEKQNPHYTFKANTTKLKDNIDKIYTPGNRNELGYRVVHVLRRAGYTQDEVEELFLDLHYGNMKDFNETIGGSIKAAYSKDINQLCGLKHLLIGINTIIPGKNKVTTIKFFKESFGYYEKPVETITTPFTLNGDEITVKILESSQDKWIVFESIFKGIDLNINFNNWIGRFIRVEDEFEIISFEFKFNKQMFKITKTEENTISSFLKNSNIEVPKLLFEYIKQYFRNADSEVTEKKQYDPSSEIYALFTNKNIKLRHARRKLGHFLKEKGMILRQGINTPYFLDKKSNGFNSVTTDDIIMALDKNIFNHEDVIHTDDVEEALGFIADRRRPVYNIVKFPNCLYDIKNFKVIKKTEDPVFTLTEVKYNYNPQAKSEKIKEFLRTSLKQEEDSDEELKDRITGFLEMIGYILTSGNKLAAFFILAGIGGAGKGVATNLITHIFGTDKVGGLQLQELTPDNKFATAHLESKQVNIVRDSPKKPIKDTGMLKSITGYDDIPIEHKGKDKYMIPKEEVPDMILVCNNIPKFEDGVDSATVQRIVMFEFLTQFRGTERANKNLLAEIFENDEEMEWLIFHGIEAYKEMINKDTDFKARISEDKTRDLLGKHTDPITYVLPDLVKTTNEDISSEDPIIAKELNEMVRYLIEKKGMSVTDLDNQGRIKPRVLAEKIREYFDLQDWSTESKYIPGLGKSETVYPNLYKTGKYDALLNEMKESKRGDVETEKI